MKKIIAIVALTAVLVAGVVLVSAPKDKNQATVTTSTMVKPMFDPGGGV